MGIRTVQVGIHDWLAVTDESPWMSVEADTEEIAVSIIERNLEWYPHRVVARKAAAEDMKKKRESIGCEVIEMSPTEESPDYFDTSQVNNLPLMGGY